MKPQVQKIFTKLAKEKVELSEAKAKALAKDFRKAESGLKAKKKILDNLVKELKSLEKLKLTTKKEYDEASDFLEIYGRGKDRYNSLYDEFEKKARELGVKVDQIPVMKELDKAFDDAANAYVPVSQMLGDVRRAMGEPF